MSIANFARSLNSSIFTIILGITGIYLTAQYLKVWKHARQTANWPSVPGEVTTSWVKSSTSRRRGSYAIIKYTYTVMGQTYESDKLSSADALDMRLEGPRVSAKRVTNKYPRGSKVTVYYDPQNPANAVLQRDLNSSNGQALVVAVILVDIAAVVAIGITLYNLL